MRLRKRLGLEEGVTEQVEPLNEAEREWVANNTADAAQLLTASGLRADGSLSAAALDDLWALLLREEPEDPNPAINLVGLAFGQLLADRLGLSWVALTDEHGTEIAVRGDANFTVFPTNFVAKRYVTRETGFLASAYNEMVKTAEALG
jgi:hypothetical protein